MEYEKIQKLLKDYPNRVPVVIWQTPNFERYFKLTKHKYLINSENTVGMLLFHIKQINNLKTDRTMYLFVHNTPLCTSDTFGALRSKFKYDSVLNLTIDCDSAFG